MTFAISLASYRAPCVNYAPPPPPPAPPDPIRPRRYLRMTYHAQGRSDGGYIGIYTPKNQSTLIFSVVVLSPCNDWLTFIPRKSNSWLRYWPPSGCDRKATGLRAAVNSFLVWMLSLWVLSAIKSRDFFNIVIIYSLIYLCYLLLDIRSVERGICPSAALYLLQLWPFGVTWRHRSRDRWIRDRWPITTVRLSRTVADIWSLKYFRSHGLDLLGSHGVIDHVTIGLPRHMVSNEWSIEATSLSRKPGVSISPGLDSVPGRDTPDRRTNRQTEFP